MSRFDAVGLFWNDPAKLTKGTPKPVAIKILPPSLQMEGVPGDICREAVPELISVPSGTPQVIMDIECYPNYFLVLFKRLGDGKVIGFENFNGLQLDRGAIEDIIKKYEVITFNGTKYDIPMLRFALSGVGCGTLFEVSNQIITQRMTPYQFEKAYDLVPLYVSHIDLIEVAPGVMDSLKVYGARLHAPKLQDLPYEPGSILTPAQRTEVRKYCKNDLDVTELLYLHLQGQISLRRAMSTQYNRDLRSKSDPQIAEEIIKSEVLQLSKSRLLKREVQSTKFLYDKPDFVSFNTISLQDALEIVTSRAFTIDDKGRVEMPKELLTLRVSIGNSTYQMGMGGLHSTESSVHHITDSKHILFDWDVASYYPQIILNCGLYPLQLGEAFLQVYKTIVEERLFAKHEGNKVKAESLKICVNGSFGKLGSPYSILYAPELMVQVTVTGQLSLLMLIESMEQHAISVVSANTDGIVIKCPVAKEKLMRELIGKWENVTGFTMEESLYSGIFSRDVNNYIAVKYDGTVKTKGCFNSATLSKNPSSEICNLALVNYLKYGTAFEDIIYSCKDITRFVSVRFVKGGALYKGAYLGKVVRWYYAKGSKDSITYKTNGKQVAKTYGCKPLMDLPAEFPVDVDLDWYVQECYKLL